MKDAPDRTRGAGFGNDGVATEGRRLEAQAGLLSAAVTSFEPVPPVTIIQ